MIRRLVAALFASPGVFPVVTPGMMPGVMSGVMLVAGLSLQADPVAAQTRLHLSGVVDAGMARIDSGQGAAWRIDSGLATASHWRLDGREDLGDGRTVFFRLESDVELDSGAGGIAFARAAYLGLETDFGQFWFGRDRVSGYHALQVIDSHGLGLYGNLLTFAAGQHDAGASAGAMPGTAAGGAVPGLQTQVSNGLFFRSGNWDGLRISAHLALPERDAEPRLVGGSAGLAFIYRRNPWLLAGWLHDRSLAAGLGSIKEWGGGGSYHFGFARLSLGFGAGDPTGPTRTSFLSFGAAVPMGAATLSAQYLALRESASGGRAGVPSLAYVQPLSRRTSLYATVGRTDNQTRGSFGLSAAGQVLLPAAVGNDLRAMALGIRHAF